MDRSKLEILVDRYLKQETKDAEKERLMEALEDADNEAIIKEILGERWETWQQFASLGRKESEELFTAVMENLPEGSFADKSPKISWWTWRRVAAAVVIFLLTGGGLYWLSSSPWQAPTPQATTSVSPDYPPISSPSSTHAVLTLANGKKVFLDSLQKGGLNRKGVHLSEGEINYSASSGKGTALRYNTLSIPKGSKMMKMVLSDGSKVWLNAASSIRFPVSFGAKNRDVKITGEAYFEIAKDEQRPFIVRVGSTRIQVLGTHFNIKAYKNEAFQATLLQGKISVNHDGSQQILSPGQQARVGKKGVLSVIHSANIQDVMAWKNGFFSFHQASIETIMKQLACWYDVEVVYKGGKPQGTFSGEIDRTLSLQEMLTILDKTRVHYKIKSPNKIIIMQ